MQNKTSEYQPEMVEKILEAAKAEPTSSFASPELFQAHLEQLKTSQDKELIDAIRKCSGSGVAKNWAGAAKVLLHFDNEKDAEELNRILHEVATNG